MKRLKNKSGITLIALVITILILLILAGVAINLAIGERGIFNQSKQAAKEYEKSALEEDLDMAMTEYQMRSLALTDNASKKSLLIEVLTNSIKDADITANADSVTVVSGENEYTVYLNGSFNYEGKSYFPKVETTVAKQETGAKISIKVTPKSKKVTKIEIIKPDSTTEVLSEKPEGVYERDYPVTVEGIYKIRATIETGEDKTYSNINVDLTAPTVTVTEDTSKTGQDRFTVNVVAQDTSSIVKYIYYLNNEKVAEIANASYEFTGLTMETEYTVKVEAEDECGNKGTSSEITVTTLDNSIIVDSIIKAIETIDETQEYQRIAVNGQKYDLHLYTFNADENGNVVWNSQNLPTLGVQNDVGSNTEDAKKMVVAKINGNLVIESNTTITPYGTEYGGPKGFFIYATGNITNSGTINMTARGAKGEGQDVYLWKNTNNSYEVVPAVGANGGTRIQNTTASGRAGSSGASKDLRATGGGGSGALFRNVGSSSYSGNGSAGTSYAGGSGGAGAHDQNYPGEGPKDGIAGGRGGITGTWDACGGGAGIPGGLGEGTGYAENGTGGLLIIHGNNIINNTSGNILSNGSKGYAAQAGGGSSGGGSINIFYRNELTNNGTIQAVGYSIRKWWKRWRWNSYNRQD